MARQAAAQIKSAKGFSSPGRAVQRLQVQWMERGGEERVAGVTGLEPAASGVTGRRSNQLSYTPSPSRLPKLRFGDDGRGIRQARGGVKQNPLRSERNVLALRQPRQRFGPRLR